MRWLAWILLRVKHSESELGTNPKIFDTVAKLTRLEVFETPLNPQILYIVQIARARMESTPPKHVDHNRPLLACTGEIERSYSTLQKHVSPRTPLLSKQGVEVQVTDATGFLIGLESQ
jgi:hypothetical protein